MLLYQAYLKGETYLDPEIKAALLRMVKLDYDLPLKIRMLQADYLNMEFAKLDGKWNEATDILFPKKESEKLKVLSNTREETIKEYKNTVSELLQSFY